MFDKSRIGLISGSKRQEQQRYAEDQNLSDDVSDTSWDHRRSSSSVKRSGSMKDLSEVLRRSRQGQVSSTKLRSSVSVGGLRSGGGDQEPSGIKSRLGAGAERKRRLDSGPAVTPAKRAMLSMTNNLKQSIIKTVQDNEKKSGGLRQETFIERRTKTGEVIDWDNKLARPRMGMVADMKDQRVSALNRIKGSQGKEPVKEVIKRTVPNQRPGVVSSKKATLERNVVMTEVVEEDVFDDFNIVRTVQNDFDYEDDAMEEGFFDDRVVRTRDKLSELQIRKQKRRDVDLEFDDGSDLPEWNDRVKIEVDNDDHEPEQAPLERPKLHAKRSLETKKSKQLREVERELREVVDKEKKLKAQERKELELKKEEESLRKEQEALERSKKVDAEKKKAESEKKRREDEEKEKIASKRRIEEMKRKNEELKLEEELKQREAKLKAEEDERQIKELQRQDELMANKLKVLERQKQLENEKKELERVKQEKIQEITNKKKEAADSKIKAEIKLIEEQEKQIKDRQKELQRKRMEKKKEMKGKEKSKRSSKKKRRYSSEESSSSESDQSESESESSSSGSESETSLSESEDSEYEQRSKRKQHYSKQKEKRKSPKKEAKRQVVPSSSKESSRRKDDRRSESSRSAPTDRKKQSTSYNDNSKDGGVDLKDKLKSYLNRAKSREPPRRN